MPRHPLLSDPRFKPPRPRRATGGLTIAQVLAFFEQLPPGIVAPVQLAASADNETRLQGLRALELHARAEASLLSERMFNDGTSFAQLGRLQGMSPQAARYRVRYGSRTPGPHQQLWNEYCEKTTASVTK